MFFHQKLESIQYNTCLTITGVIQGISKETLYQKLGFESLQLRRWYRKLWMFIKIYRHKSPQYLLKLLPEKTHAYVTRNVDNIPYIQLYIYHQIQLFQKIEQPTCYPSEFKKFFYFQKWYPKLYYTLPK